MKFLFALLNIPLAALLVSCGTVSEVQPTTGVSSKRYSRVLIRDFKYTEEDGEDGLGSPTTFPNTILTYVIKNGGYSSVVRNGKANSETLVIEGEVTTYNEGNPMLRAMVGFGAGSSYFDANVRFVDGGTGKVVGTMDADKNSWVLGGGLAAGQTAQGFMIGAAQKVGEESLKFSKRASQP